MSLQDHPEVESQVVVIIDDIATNRAIFARLSASIHPGVEVKSFDQPDEAIAWLRVNSVDLILVDYKMPGMDGSEFVRQFRANHTGREVPVVVITAYDDREFRISALDAGATDFLHSPIDHLEFKTRIRNLLKLSLHQKHIEVRAIALEEELKESERSRDRVLRDSSERLAQVIDTVPAIISAADADGRCIFASAYMLAMAGLDPLQPSEQIPALFGQDYLTYHRSLDQVVLRSGQPLPEIEEAVIDSEGRELTLVTTKAPLRDGTGAIIGVLTTSMDITARKRAESRLAYLAHHDHLTGLPNRALLLDSLKMELALERPDNSGFALLFIDLDRFKSINDGLGHHSGDQLLRAVARRLRNAVRAGDVVARIGGDEFAVLQSHVTSREDAAAVARQINDILDRPFAVGGCTVTMNASIGIALFPDHGRDENELLQNADLAMYRAKVSGRRAFHFFAEDMRLKAKSSIGLQSDLRRAIARQQFVLHYQPQVDLLTGELIGVEALVRWQRPDHGLLPPAAFMAVAEESGLILPINEWVLAEACRQAVLWIDGPMPNLRIAVNIASLQLQRENLSSLVLTVLEQTGLPPHLLELELTETILLEHAQAARDDLDTLRKRGVRLAIDDFGTGHSSLAHLRDMPVDRLKIDRSFIEGLALPGSNDAAIVRAVVNMGRELDIEVLAEGVETAEQVRHLQAEGCRQAQGFFYSRPLAAAEFEASCRQPPRHQELRRLLHPVLP
jgi:diguanylate cyclase (GGDEF)-like protein/PAS domain S-box-containing protein